jgi:hypothetical protein
MGEGSSGSSSEGCIQIAEAASFSAILQWGSLHARRHPQRWSNRMVLSFWEAGCLPNISCGTFRNGSGLELGVGGNLVVHSLLLHPNCADWGHPWGGVGMVPRCDHDNYHYHYNPSAVHWLQLRVQFVVQCLMSNTQCPMPNAPRHSCWTN